MGAITVNHFYNTNDQVMREENFIRKVIHIICQAESDDVITYRYKEEEGKDPEEE